MPKRFLFISLLLLAAGTAYAGHLDLVRRFCFEELVPVIDEWRIRVPVGCEAFDCCPGCPGPPLDWQIFASEPMELTFRGLQPELREKLRLEGGAKWTGPNTLSLEPGRSVVSGFPSEADKPPVADVKFAGDPAKLADKSATTDRLLRFEVQQQLGATVVNETRARYTLFPCPSPPGDRLRLDNNASGDSSVALLDARRAAGCVNDEPSHLATIKDMGSVLSNGACNSEVAVFSADDAMQLKTAVSTWHDPLGDLTPVDLTPDIRNTPLSVWVMRGTFANTSTRVNNDRARATQLYNMQGVGTTVSVTSLHDSTADPDTAGLLNADCGSAASLRSRIGFDNGRLNVYYLNDPGARGWWCGNNTIIIGSGADNESLAHEIGHAFSLGHTNGIAGIPNTNLMITGGTGRNSITKGQGFRCNINASSTMNTNGTRAGLTRNCPDATTSSICPALALNP